MINNPLIEELEAELQEILEKNEILKNELKQLKNNIEILKYEVKYWRWKNVQQNTHTSDGKKGSNTI